MTEILRKLYVCVIGFFVSTQPIVGRKLKILKSTHGRTLKTWSKRNYSSSRACREIFLYWESWLSCGARPVVQLQLLFFMFLSFKLIFLYFKIIYEVENKF